MARPRVAARGAARPWRPDGTAEHVEPGSGRPDGVAAAMHRTAAWPGPGVASTVLGGSRFAAVRDAAHDLGALGGPDGTATRWADVARVACAHRLRIPGPGGGGAGAAAELLGVEVLARLRDAHPVDARRALRSGLRAAAGGPASRVVAGESRAVAVLQLYAGRPVAARRVRARTTRRRSSPAGPVPGVALSLYRAGRWDDALAAATEAEARLVDDPMSLPFVHRAVAAEILWQRGRIDPAADWLAREHGLPLLTHLLDWSRAGLLAATGDPGAALAAVTRARATARHERSRITGRVLGRQVRLALAAGDTDRAAAVLRRLRVVAMMHGDRDSQWELALAEARVRRTAAAGRRVLALAAGLGRPPDLARARVAAAGCAGPDTDRLLTAALADYDLLGAVHARSGVAAALRARGLRVPPEQRGPDGRTPSEGVLADLLAHGHSNRVIAAVLVRSEKRIEAMVASLAAQTGARGRVELAQQLRGGTTAKP